MTDDVRLANAKQYEINGIEEAVASLIWPLHSQGGPVALIKVDLAYRGDYCTKTSNIADKAIALVKQHFVSKIDAALIIESVAGVPSTFAHMWVVNQDEAHQDFALIWNFVDHVDVLERMSLPPDLLDLTFVTAELPEKLPLSSLQAQRIDALQKSDDTSALLECLETIQDLLSRSPGKIKISVSDETAIALLAIHGAEAAQALEGVGRFPD